MSAFPSFPGHDTFICCYQVFCEVNRIFKIVIPLKGYGGFFEVKLLRICAVIGVGD